MELVSLASIVVALIFALIAVFQVLLSFGYPLGEYAMGGNFKVLPIKLRVVCAGNTIFLLLMGTIFLQHTNVIHRLDFIPTNILVWLVTIYLGLNTIANLFSRSKKERYVMTPISSVTFLLCLFIALKI